MKERVSLSYIYREFPFVLRGIMESRLNMAPEWRTEQLGCKITTGSPVIAIEF